MMRCVGYVGMGFVTVVISFGFLVMTGFAHAADDEGFWLITPEEAAMAAARKIPDRDLNQIGAESGLGPKIDVLKPTDGGSMPSPVEVDVKFTPKISPVDLPSMKVTLIKLINVDITGRVLPYASEGGIYIPSAQLPSGKHTVRVSIADHDGLRSVKDVSFEVLDGKP